MLQRRSSGSAESFQRQVAVVCVISCSGLFHAAPAFMFGMINGLGVLGSQAERAQVVAALLCAGLRRAVAGEDILFDDDPAVVVRAAERGGYGGQIRGAGAQLAEQLCVHRGEVAESSRAR